MYTGWRDTTIPGTISTLYLLPTEGAANLIDVHSKCHAHFLSRCLQQLQTEDVYTAAWLKLWISHFYMATVLHMGTIPTRFHYLWLHIREICYMTTAVRHTAGKYHTTSTYVHLLAVKQYTSKCGYSYRLHPQSDQMSGGTNILFQSTT